MFDEVWEVLLTCKVHMYTDYMLVVDAYKCDKIGHLNHVWQWLLVTLASGIKLKEQKNLISSQVNIFIHR